MELTQEMIEDAKRSVNKADLPKNKNGVMMNMFISVYVNGNDVNIVPYADLETARRQMIIDFEVGGFDSDVEDGFIYEVVAGSFGSPGHKVFDYREYVHENEEEDEEELPMCAACEQNHVRRKGDSFCSDECELFNPNDYPYEKD